MMMLMRPAAALASRLRPDRLTLLIAAIALTGFGLVMARQATYGPALSSDSLFYVSVARNLLAGEGFYFYTGEPLTSWPPLYPIALAAAGLGVFDPRDVAGPLNAVLFGLTIFAAGQYLRWRLQSRFLAVWGCIAVALSIPLINAASFALSGSLFVLMTTLALIQTDKFLKEGRTSSLIWAAVFCALAWQTRYIGIAAPLLAGLLLLFQRGAPLPQKTRRVAGFSLIAGLPMALWLLNNYLISGDLPGNRRPVDYYLPDILSDVASGLWGWACAAECAADMSLARWLSLALLLLTAAIMVIAEYVFIKKQWGRRLLRQWRPCWIFGGFALIYAGLLVAGLMLGHTHHGVEQRFLAPLYIPLLVIVAVAVDRFLSGARYIKTTVNIGGLIINRTLVQWGVKTPDLITVILALTLSLWAALQFVPNAVLIRQANSGDLYLGYAGPRWAGSETLRYTRENLTSGKVYSNHSHLLYIHDAGPPDRHTMPASRYSEYDPNAAAATGQEQLNQWLAHSDNGAYVVWFNRWRNMHRYDYGAANLRTTPGMEPVAELSDGAIYRVNRDYTPAVNPYILADQAITAGDYGEPAARSDFDIYILMPLR